MRLDINGEIVAAPTASDIVKGIDGRDGRTAWYLTLTRPDGFYLEVTPADIGTSNMLRLANGNAEQGLRHIADVPIAPEQAKSILSDFLRGGTACFAMGARALGLF